MISLSTANLSWCRRHGVQLAGVRGRAGCPRQGLSTRPPADGVFAVAIGVVALPSLARAALDRGDFDGELVRAVRLQAVILLPLAVATALLADDIVDIAYERGAFNEASSALTSDALVGVAVALPALGLSLVGTRAWISRRRPWTPALVATVGLVLNAGLDAALIGPLGVMGICIDRSRPRRRWPRPSSPQARTAARSALSRCTLLPAWRSGSPQRQRWPCSQCRRSRGFRATRHMRSRSLSACSSRPRSRLWSARLSTAFQSVCGPAPRGVERAPVIRALFAHRSPRRNWKLGLLGWIVAQFTGALDATGI